MEKVHPLSLRVSRVPDRTPVSGTLGSLPGSDLGFEVYESRSSPDLLFQEVTVSSSVPRSLALDGGGHPIARVVSRASSADSRAAIRSAVCVLARQGSSHGCTATSDISRARDSTCVRPRQPCPSLVSSPDEKSRRRPTDFSIPSPVV